MKGEQLHEALRARALELSKTIHMYLDPKINIIDLQRTKELLATLEVMDQVNRENRSRQ